MDRGPGKHAAISAARAHALGDTESLRLARYICHRGRRRVIQLLDDTTHAPDDQGYHLARSLMEKVPETTHTTL